MNAKIKTFLLGLASGILTVLGALFLLIFRKPPRSIQDIASAADDAIKHTAAEIKNDSDQALAKRFDTLAKKAEK